jgi:hypothetical protein
MSMTWKCSCRNFSRIINDTAISWRHCTLISKSRSFDVLTSWYLESSWRNWFVWLKRQSQYRKIWRQKSEARESNSSRDDIDHTSSSKTLCSALTLHHKMQFKVSIESKNENEKINASEMTEAEAKVDRDRFELIIEMIDRLKMKISRTTNQTWNVITVSRKITTKTNALNQRSRSSTRKISSRKKNKSRRHCLSSTKSSN